MEFIVTTHERVEGRYLVEAETLEAARAKFESMKEPGIDWANVEQLGYLAYAVAVEKVTEA